MLGETGGAWLNRLHMQLARELRGQGWSQMNIASILGTTKVPFQDNIRKESWIYLVLQMNSLLMDEQKKLLVDCCLLARPKNC